MHRTPAPSRIAFFALAAALSFALPAAATIDTMFINHVSGPALCSSFANNPEVAYETFMSQGHRIQVPRGATFLVELDGFGADFATGTQDNISGLSSSIVGHGSHNSPSGGVSFGQPAQTGFVTVKIVAGPNATLGNGHVQVNWLTGHEVIPLTIVASCAPPPTPRPAPTPAPGAFIPRQLGAVAANPTLLPDLVPTDFVNFRTCNPNPSGVCIPNPNDCNGAFTGQRHFTQPDLQFGVRNISSVNVATPFAVVLKKADGTQLQRVTVPNLAANASAVFTFHRPTSDVCVQQIGPNKLCFYCAIAIDDTGITVVVDADNVIAEVSESNNSRKIQ